MVSKVGKYFLSGFSFLAMAGMLANPAVSVAQTITASTSMTVMSVNKWINEATKSPSESEFYKETVKVWDVTYTPHSICWQWSPRDWPTGTTALNGRIWKFFTEDGFRHFTAQSWDWIAAHHECKERSGPVPNAYLGFMLSSLCDTGGTCAARERSNIDFQNPANPNF